VLQNNIPFSQRGTEEDFLMKNITVKSSLRFICLVPILLFLSCSAKEIKVVSPEAKITQEAIELAETLKNAYIKSDRRTLENNSTQDYYRELAGAMKTFSSAELTFTPTWVEIQDSTVNVTVSWKGTWAVNSKTTEERGIAIFMFEGTPLKLAHIQRSNPFRQPE
jgi:hypothetical protein